MKISSQQIYQIARLYSQERAVNVKKAYEPTLGKDCVSLSAEGKEAQAIRQKLAEVPDIRQDKVDELKRAIQSGSYRVSGKDIADKMLGRILADILINRE